MTHNNAATYLCNNWLKENTSPLLATIAAKGGALVMNKSGALLYRLLPNEPFLESKDYRAISEVFTNFIGAKVELINPPKQKKSELDDASHYVAAQDLKLIIDKIFDPYAAQEFIEAENGLYYLNKYIPSPYMQLECSNDFHSSKISAILALIQHLSNYDRQRVDWIINWLAYFFQGLKKSQVALVLRGEQGAGKNILFNEIIKPIIGEAYTKAINDKTFNSQYLGGLVEDTLFFNLDEISVQRAKNATVKNFLKALVTNPTITAEKKYKTLERESKIYAQILITSNEVEVLEVESSDRRYTVFNTAGELKNTNFLHYGSYEALSSAIKDELGSFICFLKNYSVDVQSANMALMTPEKEQLICLYMQKQQANQKSSQPKPNKLQKSIQEFVYAIRIKDFAYFESIRFDAPALYSSVMNDLYNNFFRISNLLPAFRAVYGKGLFKTTSELLRELNCCDPYQFNSHNRRIVTINDTQEECYIIAVLYHQY